MNGRDIVLREPSVIALNRKTGKILSVGAVAKDMIGKTPDHIQAVMPLADGVIADYDMTEQMIKYYLKKVCMAQVFKPRVIICVPSGITEVESRTVISAAVAAGARKV
jgi:rod shape-determining protein MreB